MRAVEMADRLGIGGGGLRAGSGDEVPPHGLVGRVRGVEVLRDKSRIRARANREGLRGTEMGAVPTFPFLRCVRRVSHQCVHEFVG